MSIYTKKGDKGYTSLIIGKRVRKDHKIIEALGAIDELSAWMGILHLNNIQSTLMDICSVIAGESRILNLESRVQELEKEIDKMDLKLPKLKNFILPRNQIHIARAVCRRAERTIVSLVTSHQSLATYIKYLNRLSDYLFVLARFEDFKKKKIEIIWKF